MTVRVSLDADAKFAEVARSIAKGNPPEWLVIGLTHFSSGISVDTSKERRSFDKQIEQMQDAIHVLMTRLPAWAHLGYGHKCPEHVALAFYALPRLKKDLDRVTKKGLGRPADVRREVCAAVVLEAWKIIRSKAEPHSLYLRQACCDYWQGCGGEQDDPDNWRRHIERALTVDHSWISQVLLALKGHIDGRRLYRMHAK